MQKKGLGFLLLAGLLIISALVFLPANKDSAQAQTGFSISSGKIFGWLWSDNIGWIRVGSTDADSVKIANNNLQGYGWSDSIGWINFAPASGYPEAPSHGVQIESTPITTGGSDYAVTGWARACSVFVSGCSGTLKDNTARGDWDGWIKMVNSKYDSLSKTFSGSGFAWGDLNLGWTNFHAGDPDIDCRDIPLPPGCPANCTPGVNCTCNDPQPPPGCPAVCVGCNGTTLACTASPSPANVGQTVTFSANLSGTGYTYIWGGNTGTVAPIPTTNPLVTNYSSAGTKNVTVEVKNGSGISLGNVSCNGTAGVVVQCVAPTPFECPNGTCAENAGSCPGSCTIGDMSAGRIVLVFDYGDTSSIVESSEAAEALTLTPSSGCSSSNPLNIVFNPLSGTLPSTAHVVCSTDLTTPNWVSCDGLNITSPILIGVQAPANLDRTGLINGNSYLMDIRSAAGAGNAFPRWIRFYGPSIEV